MSSSCAHCSWRSGSQRSVNQRRVALVALYGVRASSLAAMDTHALDALTDGMCLRCLRDVIKQTAIVAVGIANRLGVEHEWHAVVADLVPSWALTPLNDGPP